MNIVLSALCSVAVLLAGTPKQAPVQPTVIVSSAGGVAGAGLPEGATLEDGLFSWTPTEAQIGKHYIRFTVSDGELEDYEDVMISVFSKYDLNQDWAVNILDFILLSQHMGEVWP